jgi:uncharacterized repeat protein (TIGR03803 family)
VVFGQDQNLYGVTLSGNNQDGTAFKIVPNGAASQFHTIHQFAGGSNDISAPNGLTLAGDGNLYGTSSGGGTQNFGAIFQLTTGRSRPERRIHWKIHRKPRHVLFFRRARCVWSIFGKHWTRGHPVDHEFFE